MTRAYYGQMDDLPNGWMGELIAIFTTAGNVFYFGLKAKYYVATSAYKWDLRHVVTGSSRREQA